jgi:DNA-binding MarR family transcriptional regulator
MSESEKGVPGKILDRFIEGIFRLMLEHHRTHVLELELTGIQAHALSYLSEAPSPATRLAGSLGISGPAMTQLTDRLVRKRLIERRQLDGDRRAVLIALTEQGHRVVDRFRKRRSEVFAEALSRLNAPDQTEVVDALNKLVIALEGPQVRRDAPALAAVPLAPPKRRTAVEPPEASKEEAGETPVSSPPRSPRRMRIEWD